MDKKYPEKSPGQYISFLCGSIIAEKWVFFKTCSYFSLLYNIQHKGECIMAYYHCSPTAGLAVLEPRKPESFEKPARVYMTTLLPMALMYTVRNYEYSYGYTKEGQIYFDEYFPNALEILYRGKSASLYLCDPDSIEPTRIPNEAISETAVPVISETHIPDAYEALLEQERLGTLVIHRYQELSAGMLNWIRKVEADCIRKSNLLNSPGPMADYYQEHYPRRDLSRGLFAKSTHKRKKTHKTTVIIRTIVLCVNFFCAKIFFENPGGCLVRTVHGRLSHEWHVNVNVSLCEVLSHI